MAALCEIRERADAWLDDPDAVRAEFDALMAENFPAEPPGTGGGPVPPPDRDGPEWQAPRRTLRPGPSGTAPATRRVARERGPPATR